MSVCLFARHLIALWAVPCCRRPRKVPEENVGRFEKHRSTDRFVLVPELHPSLQKPGGLISAINEKNEIKHTYSLAKSKTTRFVLACQCNVSLYVAIF